ncbi:MAG: AAA family ATPase, partial [Ignavibacteria bacterium]|nr:AAA family ATPase [Ignavibacteria bacterium]
VSSGEYHLFSSLIGILALVEENSLILLDEPDISLHPNWQMKYISFLKNIFKNYPTCHFIASTHSHFLVSDMEPSTSHLIGLRKDYKNDIVESLELPKSTFGWTAEEVLYSVFNVKSTRNSYLEYDLTKLITLINRNDKNFIEIRRIKEKIEKLKFSESDPLLIIIEKTEKYLRDNNA